MLSRVLAIAVFAIFAGVALSLRDLILPSPRQIPLPLGNLVMVGWVLALVAIGWVTAQLTHSSVGLVMAPAAVLLAVSVAVVAKQLRYPTASLTGDGFAILIWVWVLIGVAGAIIGLHPAVRVKSSQLAATIGAGLLVVAGAVGAVPYLLAR